MSMSYLSQVIFSMGSLIMVFLVLSEATVRHGKINSQRKEKSRKAKFLSAFQIIRFQNGPCAGSSKNGTCYTVDECDLLGGKREALCADGFGVCCTFTVGCGGTSSQNCTYMDSELISAGGCQAQICPLNDDICQLRLDFNNFVIAGPTTLKDAVTKTTAGVPSADDNAVPQSSQTQCQTDTFSITNPNGNVPPIICGTNTGQHMYVDASNSCNSMIFQLGNSGIGTSIPTRSWSIKVVQFSCNYPNLAPQGCTKYFSGSDSGALVSYNYNNGKGNQLANQRESFCIRICYYTINLVDFNVSGDKNNFGLSTSDACCGYGDGKEGVHGFDCIQIPNVMKSTDSALPLNTAFCGNKGLVTMPPGDVAKTICSSTVPFRVHYLTDNFEGINSNTTSEGFENDPGFVLQYKMDDKGC